MDDVILRVAARWLGAKEHPTEEAREEYLKKHPKADPAKHTVKKGPETKKVEEPEAEREKAQEEPKAPEKPKAKDKPAKKAPKPKEEPSEGSKGLSGILKPDEEELNRIADEHKEVFASVTAQGEKEAETFKSKIPENHAIAEQYEPGLLADTRDLMAEIWPKLQPAERAIHMTGHLIGENFEKTLSAAEMKRHENYFERWRTSAGSYDREGYGQPEDFDHDSQELQGLVASLGVKGSPAPDDIEDDKTSQGGVEKARKKGAKDAKLAAYVKKMYDYQQAYFKSVGLKEITLYRGVTGPRVDDADEGSRVSVECRELSSFTADPNKAKTFGRAVEYKVPVERIFASSLVRPGIGSETYEGSFNEAEFIVMGASDMEGTIISRKGSKGRGRNSSESKVIEVPISNENEGWMESMRPKKPKPRPVEAKLLAHLTRIFAGVV